MCHISPNTAYVKYITNAREGRAKRIIPVRLTFLAIYAPPRKTSTYNRDRISLIGYTKLHAKPFQSDYITL